MMGHPVLQIAATDVYPGEKKWAVLAFALEYAVCRCAQ